jgi:hypothetical protein
MDRFIAPSFKQSRCQPALLYRRSFKSGKVPILAFSCRSLGQKLNRSGSKKLPQPAKVEPKRYRTVADVVCNWDEAVARSAPNAKVEADADLPCGFDRLAPAGLSKNPTSGGLVHQPAADWDNLDIKIFAIQ